MDDAELKRAVETLLFITDSPLKIEKIAEAAGEKDRERVARVIAQLQEEYRERPVQVLEIAEGFQMATRPEFAPCVRRLYSERMTMRLSTAALETISIIAYKQPITRAEIEQVRGVEVIAALETLLEKGLVRVVGRKESVGRPLLYGTTVDFLRQFGLRGLQDLPPMESLGGAPAPAPAEAPADASSGEGRTAGAYGGDGSSADGSFVPSTEGPFLHQEGQSTLEVELTPAAERGAPEVEPAPVSEPAAELPGGRSPAPEPAPTGEPGEEPVVSDAEPEPARE